MRKVESKDSLPREVRNVLTLTEAIENQSLNEIRSIVNELRQKVILLVVECGEISPLNAGTLKQGIVNIVHSYRIELENIFAIFRRKMFINGIRLADVSAKINGYQKKIPFLNEKIIEEQKEKCAVLLNKFCIELQTKIFLEINLAILTQKPIHDIVKNIGSNLQYPSLFSGIAKQAEELMRKENIETKETTIEERKRQYCNYTEFKIK